MIKTKLFTFLLLLISTNLQSQPLRNRMEIQINKVFMTSGDDLGNLLLADYTKSLGSSFGISFGLGFLIASDLSTLIDLQENVVPGYYFSRAYKLYEINLVKYIKLNNSEIIIKSGPFFLSGDAILNKSSMVREGILTLENDYLEINNFGVGTLIEYKLKPINTFGVGTTAGIRLLQGGNVIYNIGVDFSSSF